MDIEIINKVLSNRILSDAIQNLCEPGVMNLIDTNWREILQNSTLYKKHENENLFGDGYNSVGTKIAITKQYIQDAENCFDVLVVGYFKNTKENTIKQSQCKPLEEIGKVLCKKSCLPSNIFMESCHGMCPSCRKFDALRDNKWCLKDTKVCSLPKELRVHLKITFKPFSKLRV
ncbi:uncharacterized protein TNCT_171681 [Trichonephila clavata]|uniref:Uncharacterized protein n=1 Tax=Trichonephila clavata TaxID=2740835 RepID=A0A8X6G6L6_TRICU|nr:uncharacterized protein TNCT_171681 [Trichonephila clavata]